MNSKKYILLVLLLWSAPLTGNASDCLTFARQNSIIAKIKNSRLRDQLFTNSQVNSMMATAFPNHPFEKLPEKIDIFEEKQRLEDRDYFNTYTDNLLKMKDKALALEYFSQIILWGNFSQEPDV